MSQSYISETRQPFARLHDQSCVYYGIRGNTRSQYLFDNSCVLEGAMNGFGVGVMPVVHGQMPTLLSGPMVTLLGGKVSLLSGRMPSLLSAPVMPELVGPQAELLSGPALPSPLDVAVVKDLLKQLNDSPSNAVVYVSKSGSGSGAGDSGGINFVVIPTAAFDAMNRVLSATSSVPLKTIPLTDSETFVPDAGARVSSALFLKPILSAALASLGAKPGLSTKAKIALGVGAAAVLAGVGYLIHRRSSKGLHGARGRRRKGRR
jgi:hypothetical protein